MGGEDGDQEEEEVVEEQLPDAVLANVHRTPSSGSRRWFGAAMVWTKDKVMRSIQAGTRRFGGREMYVISSSHALQRRLHNAGRKPLFRCKSCSLSSSKVQMNRTLWMRS